jgi:hypothetical protein
VQFKEVDSRQRHASSFKTQEQGRKDTPGRSEVSSSFKTQQTGQGRRPKAEFNVHSDHVRSPNKTSGSQRPGQQRRPNTTNHFILFYCIYCLNFIYLFNLLFLSYLFNIQFSDHSTSNPQQEDEIWTQGGIQGLVDRAIKITKPQVSYWTHFTK